MKISHEDLKKLLSLDTHGNFCIEIEFCVLNDPEYSFSWMGKMPAVERKGKREKKIKGKDIYWFGLTEDCKQSYDFETFEEMYTAPVFNGKSLGDVLEYVDIFAIDSLSPEERLASYLSDR